MVSLLLLLSSIVIINTDALRIQGAAGTVWFEQSDEACFKKGRGPKEDPSCVCWGRSLHGHTYSGFMWCCYGIRPWGRVLSEPKLGARRLFKYYKTTEISVLTINETFKFLGLPRALQIFGPPTLANLTFPATTLNQFATRGHEIYAISYSFYGIITAVVSLTKMANFTTRNCSKIK